MKERIALLIKIFVMVLLSVSVCWTQSRQTAKRSQAAQRAPFLQQAKFFEESPYITKVVFKNGLKVLVNEHKAQPVVSIQAYVQAGFSDEPEQNPGLASLLAAMVLRGTGDKTIGTLRQNVLTLGGQFGSSVNFDNTQFEIVAPSSQWKRALNLQSDALLKPELGGAALELESSLLESQARGILDEPADIAYEKLLETSFHQPRMAKFDTLAKGEHRKILREDLVRFHSARYVPEAITLVISGDVAAGEVLNEIVRIYGKVAGPRVKHTPMSFESVQKDFRYRAIRGPFPIPRLIFGFHTVSEKDEDYRALEVLSAILGMGESSILNLRLRDQKKWILSEDTNLTTCPDFGYLSIQMEMDPANIDRSEIAAWTEIELLKRKEPDPAEMERAVAQLERSYWKRLETVTGRAATLAHFEALGDWKRMDRYVSELRQVKPSDVKRVAARYLNLQNCTLIEYLPVADTDRNLSTDSVQRTLEGLLRASADQEEAEREKETVYAVKINSDASQFKFSEVQYPLQPASILRGPVMFIREDHTSPLIDMGLFFPGGKSEEKEANAGITEMMVRLLQGSKDQNGTPLNRKLEIYGGWVQPIVADDYFGFAFSILSRNFGPGFELLRDAIKAPVFNQEGIHREKDLQLARILRLKHSKSFPTRMLQRALFAKSSYSLDSEGTEKSISGITPALLQSWYDAYVKNRKPIVVIIGDTKGTSLASHFVQAFSGSRMQDTKISQEFAKPVEKGKSLELSWERRESLILVGFQAPPEDDEDGHTAKMLQSCIGELGRLGQKMRDQLGIAHKVEVLYEPRLRGGSLTISAATNPGNEETVLKSLREEIRRITEDSISALDFRSALNASLGNFRIRSYDRSVQIENLVARALTSKGNEDYQNFLNSVQDIKEEDLQEVSQRILNLEKAVVLRVNGQSQ